jgi:hypothetical protein
VPGGSRLTDIAGIAANVAYCAQLLAERPVACRVERLIEETRNARCPDWFQPTSSRAQLAPGGALIGVAVDDEREHSDSVFVPSALFALETAPHGTALDIDVVPVLAGIDGVTGHALR